MRSAPMRPQYYSSTVVHSCPLGCVLHVFRPLSVVDVVAAVRALPDKQHVGQPSY